MKCIVCDKSMKSKIHNMVVTKEDMNIVVACRVHECECGFQAMTKTEKTRIMKNFDREAKRIRLEVINEQ